VRKQKQDTMSSKQVKFSPTFLLEKDNFGFALNTQLLGFLTAFANNFPTLRRGVGSIVKSIDHDKNYAVEKMMPNLTLCMSLGMQRKPEFFNQVKPAL
jgi:hypothetical protein